MSLPVRDHDPFCGIKGQYQVPCVICDRIEKVRADEREKAAQRIDGHSQHGYRCECGADLNDYEHHLQNVIRGEA